MDLHDVWPEFYSNEEQPPRKVFLRGISSLKVLPPEDDAPLRMSSGGCVVAWVYDSIIHSGVNRRGRDVHCVVGVLGKSSHTL